MNPDNLQDMKELTVKMCGLFRNYDIDVVMSALVRIPIITGIENGMTKEHFIKTVGVAWDFYNEELNESK